jgi:hypothetical protein
MLHESRLNILLVVKKTKLRLHSPKTVRRPQYQYSRIFEISKINFCTKKRKISRHFKKIHIKKVFFELKRKKQVENLAFFVELKRKKQDCPQETKHFDCYFSHLCKFLSCITNKKFSFLIAYRKLRAIFFLSSSTKTARLSTCFLLLSSKKTFLM